MFLSLLLTKIRFHVCETSIARPDFKGSSRKSYFPTVQNLGTLFSGHSSHFTPRQKRFPWIYHLLDFEFLPSLRPQSFIISGWIDPKNSSPLVGRTFYRNLVVSLVGRVLMIPTRTPSVGKCRSLSLTHTLISFLPAFEREETHSRKREKASLYSRFLESLCETQKRDFREFPKSDIPRRLGLNISFVTSRVGVT